MHQLSKLQSIIYMVGGVLMVVGAGLTLTEWGGAVWVFAIGALAFSAMQMLQRYEGTNITIRRLRRIMLLSDVLLLVSAFLMMASRDNALGLSQITYYQYVHGKWVGTLLLAAILQLYVMHRIDHELAKEAKKR